MQIAVHAASVIADARFRIKCKSSSDQVVLVVCTGLREHVAAAEARTAELQQQIDARGGGGGTPAVSPSKASARIALVSFSEHRLCCRSELFVS